MLPRRCSARLRRCVPPEAPRHCAPSSQPPPRDLASVTPRGDTAPTHTSTALLTPGPRLDPARGSLLLLKAQLRPAPVPWTSQPSPSCRPQKTHLWSAGDTARGPEDLGGRRGHRLPWAPTPGTAPSCHRNGGRHHKAMGRPRSGGAGGRGRRGSEGRSPARPGAIRTTLLKASPAALHPHRLQSRPAAGGPRRVTECPLPWLARLRDKQHR